MIRLQPVQAEEKQRLFNINQKYLYEMTQYYADPLDAEGNLHYGHFDAYFTDPLRKAYFIYHDDTMVGFAMVHPYSVLGQTPDYTLAEFTIFPTFRRQGFALAAARLILDTYPGRWEIKYNEKNTGAKALWTLVTAPYQPIVHHLNEVETVFSFSTRTGN